MSTYTDQGADFYVGIGEDARWVGSLREDGYPHSVADFRPVNDTWNEQVFRATVASMVSLWLEVGGHAVLSHVGDPIEPGARARYTYALQPHNGVVHVFRDCRLIELRYPTGARKDTPFPLPGAAA